MDSVNRVLNIEEKDVVPAPVKETDPVSKYVEGVIKKPEDLVLILNMPKLLDVGSAPGQKLAA